MDRSECDKGGARRIRVSSECGGLFWLVGWLFTIGFLGLGFGKGLMALLIWPVYLGQQLARLGQLPG